MRRRTIDKGLEKKILIGAITSNRVLAALEKLKAVDILPFEFSKTILRWCLAYHQEHGDAPGRHIQDIFNREKRKVGDDDTLEIVEGFLGDLSKDAEQMEGLNEDFLLKQAVEYLQSRSLRSLATDLQTCLDNQDGERAKELLQTYSMPDTVDEEVVHPFEEPDSIREAWEQQEDVLFQFRGALGSMINPYLVKGGFLGIMGPEKIGKTFFLISTMLRALMFRRKVVFFGVGDMSRNQMIKRIMVAINNRSDQERYCKGVEVPLAGRYVEIEGKEEAVLEVETETLADYSPLTWREAWRKARGFKKIMRTGELRLVCYPTDSVNIQDLRNLCKKWKQENGFVADLVIIDYADILAPEPGSMEFRHQQNQTWKAMRKWSLDDNLGQPLVITAT